jgi:hypothetical protein
MPEVEALLIRCMNISEQETMSERALVYGLRFIAFILFLFFLSAIAFFDHINLVYGTISEFCTMSGCPDMTGPGLR